MRLIALFVEFLIASTFVLFAITQVIIPLSKKRTIFPLFDRRQRELARQLRETKRRTAQEYLADELDQAQQKEQGLWEKKFRNPNRN